MINRDNYESYLFLYQEGELDSATRTEVERFLLQNPDIREEMEQYFDPTFVVTADKPSRQERHALPLWRWAAAVLVAVGLGAYLLIHSTPGMDNALVAETQPISHTHAEQTNDPFVTPSTPVPSSQYVAQERYIRPRLKRNVDPSAQPIPASILPSATEMHPQVEPLPAEDEPVSIATQATNSASDIIYCNWLAEDAILVDNIAVDEPNTNPYPSSQTNLAGMLMALSDKNRQELYSFFRREPIQQPTTYALAQDIY